MAAPAAPLSTAGRLFFGSLCAGTFGLGVWQTRRYFEKVELSRDREANLAKEPLEHLQSLKDETSVFRRVQLEGRFLHSGETLVGPRTAPEGAIPSSPSGGGAGTAMKPQVGSPRVYRRPSLGRMEDV